MIQKILSITASALLIGCSPSKVNKEFWIEPMLQSYYDFFIREGNIRNKLFGVDNLIVEFVDTLGDSILGTCTTLEEKTPVVKISRSKWGGLGDCQKDALIFHELGHCLLGRVHKDSFDSSGFPTTFMNTFLVSEYSCQQKKGELINELFQT